MIAVVFRHTPCRPSRRSVADCQIDSRGRRTDRRGYVAISRCGASQSPEFYNRTPPASSSADGILSVAVVADASPASSVPFKFRSANTTQPSRPDSPVSCTPFEFASLNTRPLTDVVFLGQLVVGHHALLPMTAAAAMFSSRGLQPAGITSVTS